MANKFVSISLIISILSLPVRFAFPYLWYFSNYDYIVQELCVNRHVPGSDCNGSCQLSVMMDHHASGHDHGEHNTSANMEIRTLFNFLFVHTNTLDLTEVFKTDLASSHNLLHKTQFIGEPPTPPPLSWT
ncbi:MAG: hypothetical protein WD355_07990 [Balneolaceae bacterium]